MSKRQARIGGGIFASVSVGWFGASGGVCLFGWRVGVLFVLIVIEEEET